MPDKKAPSGAEKDTVAGRSDGDGDGDGDTENNNPLEALAPADEVLFEGVVHRKDPIANATIEAVEFSLQSVNPHKTRSGPRWNTYGPV